MMTITRTTKRDDNQFFTFVLHIYKTFHSIHRKKKTTTASNDYQCKELYI